MDDRQAPQITEILELMPCFALAIGIGTIAAHASPAAIRFMAGIYKAARAASACVGEMRVRARFRRVGLRLNRFRGDDEIGIRPPFGWRWRDAVGGIDHQLARCLREPKSIWHRRFPLNHFRNHS